MAECRVTTSDPSVVACLSMTGPYAQMPEGFAHLYGWIEQHGLTPAGPPSAAFITSPADVPEAEARWELWAPVAGEPPEAEPDEDGVGVKYLPETLVATTVHRGPYETMAATYDALWQFIAAEGYEVVGLPVERYHSDPHTTPPEEYFTEVLVPLRKV